MKRASRVRWPGGIDRICRTRSGMKMTLPSWRMMRSKSNDDRAIISVPGSAMTVAVRTSFLRSATSPNDCGGDISAHRSPYISTSSSSSVGSTILSFLSFPSREFSRRARVMSASNSSSKR